MRITLKPVLSAFCLALVSSSGCKQATSSTGPGSSTDKSDKTLNSGSGSNSSVASGECATLVGKIFHWDGNKTCKIGNRDREDKVFLGKISLTANLKNGFVPKCAFLVHEAALSSKNIPEQFNFFVQDGKVGNTYFKSTPPGNYMSATQSFGLPVSGNYTSDTNWLINGQPASDGTPLFFYVDQSTGANLPTPVKANGSMNIKSSLVEGGSGSISLDVNFNFHEDDYAPSIGQVTGNISFDLTDANLLCNVQN